VSTCNHPPPQSQRGADIFCGVFSPVPVLPVAVQVAAKKLDRRLAALGAVPLLERGLGDDQVTPEAAYAYARCHQIAVLQQQL
jgi:hypothetical protein